MKLKKMQYVAVGCAGVFLSRRLKVRFIGLVICYTVPVRTEETARQGGDSRKERPVMNEYSMRWVRGHVEVYDACGRFRFSADSEQEALAELAEEAA